MAANLSMRAKMAGGSASLPPSLSNGGWPNRLEDLVEERGDVLAGYPPLLRDCVWVGMVRLVCVYMSGDDGRGGARVRARHRRLRKASNGACGPLALGNQWQVPRRVLDGLLFGHAMGVGLGWLVGL